MREKIKSRKELKSTVRALKTAGKKVVFTNGCFDLLHAGHVRYLEKARNFGAILVVAINSDSSVRTLKGDGRPILKEEERAEVISALGCVDFVTIFNEATPQKLIEELIPDVLVKGGDWPLDQIVGRDTVEAAGGKVIPIEFEQGFSTTAIIERIRRSGKRVSGRVRPAR